MCLRTGNSSSTTSQSETTTTEEDTTTITELPITTEEPCPICGNHATKHNYTITETTPCGWCVCDRGYAGDGFSCCKDSDGDEVPDENCANCDKTRCPPHTYKNCCDKDNCIKDQNPSQDENACDTDWKNCMARLVVGADFDKDGFGDLCDNCRYEHNPSQGDMDNDGKGDECDCDMDDDKKNDKKKYKDGESSEKECKEPTDDNCPGVKNEDQKDSDGDEIGDACDNCPDLKNKEQKDENLNGIGDDCEGDLSKDCDRDGIPDKIDNCPKIPNSAQLNFDRDDGDKKGDVCDPDIDGDGIPNENDPCPRNKNNDENCLKSCDNDGIDDQNDVCPCNNYISKLELSDKAGTMHMGENRHRQSKAVFEFNQMERYF